MQNNCKYITILALIFGPCYLVSGQATPVWNEEPIELETFTVVADTWVEPTAMLGVPVSLLDGADLKRQTAASLGETLAWEPGVNSSFYGPIASRPVIRGHSGYRAGVFNSGLSTGDLSSASPDHAVAQEPLFIDEVEVIRGPAALLYGSSAIGGAVNMKTNTLPRYAPIEPFQAKTELRYDSVNRGRTAGVAATLGEKAFAVQVNGLRRETESYRIPGLARTDEFDVTNRSRLPPGVEQPRPNSEGKVPNTQSSLATGSIGASKFWRHGWAGAAFVFYDTDYGVPSDGHAHGNPAGRRFGPGINDDVTIEMQQRKGELATELWPDAEWLDTVSLKTQYAHLKQDEFEGIFLGNGFNAHTYDTRVELHSPQLDVWTFVGGGDFSLFSLDNRNISYVAGRADTDTLSTRSLSGSVFGLAQYAQDEWEGQIGTRFELQHAERSDLTGVDRQDSAASFSLGGARHLQNDFKLGLTLSFLQRVPTADELYVEAPHGAIGVFQIPNSDLDHEESIGLDISLSKERGFWTFTATGFVQHFENYIFLENQGFEVDGLPAYRNVQRRASFIGGEIESAWNLVEREDLELTLTAFWDMVRGTDITQDEPLPRMPPMRLGVRIDGETGPWTFGAGVRHAFAQERVPQAVFGTLDYQSDTPSHTFVDANLGYTLQRDAWEARLFVNATNLTDSEGRNAVSFLKDIAPLPGRSLSVGMEVRF